MSDDELLEQFRRSGDRMPLEELCRRHFDRIYRFVGSMLGNHDTVDDVVQDVLLDVVRNIDKFRGESSFSTWLYRIASHRVYRHLKTARKALPTVDGSQVEAIEEHRSVETALAKERKQILDDAIDGLSPALRAAILLTLVEGLSPEEAAAVEGCTAANIHWRVHKARKILKERLRKHI